MAYDENSSCTLQVLLEDLDDLEDRQKGKQAAGTYTDLEFAIECMRQDILTAQTSLQDGVLALSTSWAATTDQAILASMASDEVTAEQDHLYALALSNGESPDDDLSELRGTAPMKDSDDAASVVMSDLMSRMKIGDANGLPTIEEEPSGPSRSSSYDQIPNTTKKCVSCLENFHTDLFQGSCGHEFCRECIKEMFLNAIKDEELYPPRCCGEVVPPGVALRVLNYEELRSFSERAIEWTAKDRLYCSEPTCSKFIPPSEIHDEVGTCRSCQQRTHLICRSAAHPGIDCPMDEALHEVLEMAENESWRRCFHCQTMVELQHGCNHITCRCGREFCYVCGQVWKTCECALWYEERLIAMANRAINEELPPNADVVYRENVFNRIVEGLRQHEEIGCEHHRSSQWAWRNRGSLECELCHHYLPEYIFMCCRNCRLRACNRCRRHRLR